MSKRMWFGEGAPSDTQIDRPTAIIYQFCMASQSISPTEEAGSTPIGAEEVAATEAKETSRSFLQSARRPLTEEEVTSPAVRRFLIAELERLDQQCAELKEFERKYNEQRVEVATLRADARIARWTEIVSFVCLSVGSAGLGAAPSYFAIKDGTTLGVMLMVFSLILVLGGIISRVIK